MLRLARVYTLGVLAQLKDQSVASQLFVLVTTCHKGSLLFMEAQLSFWESLKQPGQTLQPQTAITTGPTRGQQCTTTLEECANWQENNLVH